MIGRYHRRVASSGQHGRLVAYRIAVFLVPLSVMGLCLVMARLGHAHQRDWAYYFRDVGNVGHPGAGVVLTSMGFSASAAFSGLLAVDAPANRVRAGWVLFTLLFASLSIDNIFRAHQLFAHGDVISRVVYLSAAILAIVFVASALRGAPGRIIGMLGIGFAMASELFDLWTGTLDSYTSRFQLMTAFEESAAAVGAWCAVLALIGVVVHVEHGRAVR